MTGDHDHEGPGQLGWRGRARRPVTQPLPRQASWRPGSRVTSGDGGMDLARWQRLRHLEAGPMFAVRAAGSLVREVAG